MGVGEVKHKSRKALRVERSRLNLMGRIRTSCRYVIGIIGTDLFILEELEGVSNLQKLEKLRYF